MAEWKNVVVSPDATVEEAILRIDTSGTQVALVANGEGKLLGIVTDGDVRRAVLNKIDLSSPVTDIMNRQPTTASDSMSREEMLSLLRKKVYHHLPIVGKHGDLVGLVTITDLLSQTEHENWVVLMVGGLGKRLHPLTESIPKPLLSVGEKPILEGIIENFEVQGFRNIFLAVNHQANQIEEYFGDGSSLGVNISYVRESERLGTAGALSLLPHVPKHPIIVMNGDLLTQVKFENLLRFHGEQNASATMAVREYDIEIPFGVVSQKGDRISSIEEKPVHSYYVNAGIYALNPEALSVVPSNELFNMTTLFEKLMEDGRKTSAFPLREYWIDVGRIEEYERAQKEWPKNNT